MSRRPSVPNLPPSTSSSHSQQQVPQQRGATTGYPQASGGRYDEPPPPSRPERRRPIGSTPSPAALSGPGGGVERFPDPGTSNSRGGVNFANSFGGGGGGAGAGGQGMSRGDSEGSLASTGGGGDEGVGGGGGKSRRMMDQLNNSARSNGAPSPVPSTSSPFNNNSLHPGSASPQPPRHQQQTHHHRRHSSTSTLSSTSSTQSHSRSSSPSSSPAVPTLALTDAIQAFSTAGQSAAAGRRRGGLADQGFGAAVAAKARATALNPEEYPDTPAFREVESVLRKVRSEWGVLLDGTSSGGGAGAGGEEGEGEEGEGREFDPVSLALGLLDPSSVGGPNSLPAFLRLKTELDNAIQSTLLESSASYRAYETSITTHNSTLQSLGQSQKLVGELKKSLGNAREKLEGKGREGLVGMWGRMSHLEEMGKILDEIDHFRSIPDRLESLLSEKRFLSAVVLLVRSLKTINKPEMMEIGALTDLRSWLVMQEGVLLEILIEELHNHLYLKSFYCDVRWKSYTRGQTTLPLVDFGDDVETLSAPSHLEPSFHTSGRSTARLPRLSKLQRYLNNLSLRPSINPLVDEPIDDIHSSSLNGGGGGEDYYENGSLSAAAGMSLDAASSEAESLKNAEQQNNKRPAGKNPELDSFAYVESLMESLACLGKLGYGLDAVGQRVHGEMFSLVEAVVEEVDERNDSHKQSSLTNHRPQSAFMTTSGVSGVPLSSDVASLLQRGSLASLSSLAGSLSSSSPHSTSQSHGGGGGNNRTSLLRLTASESTALEANVETLKDVFWTLYSKLDAVLQGFRVAYEVALRIAERRDFKDASIVKSQSGNLLFSLLDIWKPVQQEVRALLHDYLTDDQTGTVSSRNPIVSVNEVLRLAKPRDSTKQIFKFADSDLKASTKALKTHEDELNRALRIAVPGLMTDTFASTAQNSIITSLSAPSSTTVVVSSSSNANANARPGAMLGGTHKALVQADAFNVSVLFGPTLAFLERVKEIMPGGLMGEEETSGSGFGGFLDEFVLRTFLPQLEEKVSTVFHQAVGGIDAFQEDPNYKKVSRVPIVKSVSNLMLLISSLCSMLRATPFHRDNYSHLIVSVIHQFYQRCHERFKDLTAKDSTDSSHTAGDKSVPLKTSASWAEMNDLNACLLELKGTSPDDEDKVKEILKRETKIELNKKGNGLVLSEDLITPSKKLLALGTLYSSLDWFILHVSSLKTSAEGLPAQNGSAFARPPDSPDASPNPDVSDDEDGPGTNFSLPLTSEMTRPFEALLKSYRQLANVVLFTLRLEIRLRTIHYLDKATRDGVYQLAEDIAEPDPSVVDLNSDLAECDECAATTLAEPERRFIFEGLSLLMDQLLISNSRHIRLANQFGLSKMMRNILALQQNLKNIGDSPLHVDFDRSRKFWDVFGRGPKEMLDAIRSGSISYDFEDYKSLLNLMCGIDQSSKDASGGGASTAATDQRGSNVPLSATTGSGAGDRSRRMYNEYLIDLFALDVEG